MKTENKKAIKAVKTTKKNLKEMTVSTSDKGKITPSNGLFVIVVILVVMSAIQVFQTQQLLNAVSSGAIKVGAPSQESSVGLPSQVGGC